MRLTADASTWTDWLALVELVTSSPIRYGPGRGLFDLGAWWITKGPARFNRVDWKSKTGRHPATFHCSSWVNFALGYLTCRDANYTHSGSVPPTSWLFERDEGLHQQRKSKTGKPVDRPYRGYAPFCEQVRGSARKGAFKPIELVERADELGDFAAFTQNFLGGRGYSHTGILYVQDGILYRIAADGSNTKKRGYSLTPMNVETLDEEWAERAQGTMLYKVWRLGDLPAGPRPPVRVEA